jgi:hypothetical protein
MSFDGTSSKSGAGEGVIFKNTQGGLHPHEFRLQFECPHAFRLQFECTKYEEKYEALIQNFTLTHQMEITNQVWKIYNIKNERLKTYVERVWDLIQTFNSINISFIPRGRN